MKNLVTIENATIDSLVSRADLEALLPCLKTHKANKISLSGKRCRRCGNSKTQSLNELYAITKDCIGNSSSAALKPIFELLDARQLRVTVRRGSSRITKTLRRP